MEWDGRLTLKIVVGINYHILYHSKAFLKHCSYVIIKQIVT